MSSAKNVVVIACAGAAESTYNQGASILELTGSNAIQLAEFVNFPSEYAYDGARPVPPGTYGTQRRVGPSGRLANIPLVIEGKGAGLQYADTGSRIPNMHALLESAGMSGSLEIADSGSDASWSFSPTPAATNPTSMGLRLYSKGEVRNISGAYCNLTIAADSAAPPLWTYELQGTLSLPTDIALPIMSYSAVVPPKAENIKLDLNFGGSWAAAKVKSFGFNLGQEISPRVDLNSATGHAGFALARRAPVYNVVIESPASATFDPELIRNEATIGSARMTVGAVAYNIWEMRMNNAQIMNVTPGEDGPVSTVELEIAGYASTPTADDDILFIFR